VEGLDYGERHGHPSQTGLPSTQVHRDPSSYKVKALEGPTEESL
jgi:hypothetical protein